MNIAEFSPDLSRDAVFRPCSREPFEFLEKVRSENLCMENSRVQFWWAANLCHLSYCHENKIKETLSTLGEDLKIFRARTQMAYSIIIDGYTFLVFQGSCSPEDTVLDLNFFPKKEESFSMHRGFHKAFTYLWPEIELFLKGADKNKLIITGHSLGGAIGYICSGKTEYYKLITFGAPRVHFGTSGIEADNDRHLRFVNCSDAVPTLPPAIFGFRHTGKMIFIDSEQGIHQNTGSKFILSKLTSSSSFLLKGKAFTKGNAPLKSLADHAPVNYSRALSRHLLLKELEN